MLSMCEQFPLYRVIDLHMKKGYGKGGQVEHSPLPPCCQEFKLSLLQIMDLLIFYFARAFILGKYLKNSYLLGTKLCCEMSKNGNCNKTGM